MQAHTCNHTFLCQEELLKKYSTTAQQYTNKLKRGQAELDCRDEQCAGDKIRACECICVTVNVTQHICIYGYMHLSVHAY